MSRRDEIRMSDDERRAFLDEQRVVSVATMGPRGWPHLMPLWYVRRDDALWAWTYTRSQKVKNLERDPRATALIESGEAYAELRGVQVEADVTLHRDEKTKLAFLDELLPRYLGGDASEQARAGMRAQAAKRTCIELTPVRTVTWDHRKLGAGY